MVLTQAAGLALVVVQACPLAQRRGVRPGMSLAQAQALVAGLVVVADEPQRDRAVLARLAHWATRFSPQVEPVEPDTLLADITGCQLLFGGEENIGRQAVAGLGQQGFQARAAIADTVGAAWALAVAGDEPLCIVPVGQGCAHLARLPPAALRIDAQVTERLEALGVRTIGDLLMLPRHTLPARFGAQLVQRLQQALGEVHEGVAVHVAAAAPLARRRFESPVADWPVIVAAAEELLAEVLEEVVRGDGALRRLEYVLYSEEVGPRVLRIELARATREARHVLQLLTQRLEQVDLAPGISGLMLVARRTACWRGEQGELFVPREPGDEEALGGLVDRLAARLGQAAVVRPTLLDDHQPECAFRYVSVVEAGCDPVEVEGRVSAMARPVRLLPRPIPVRAIALVPDGPPTWFAYRGREYTAVRAEGPERLETAWWRGPDVRRDYFRVTAETGEQFWLFRATVERRWYLHGLFV